MSKMHLAQWETLAAAWSKLQAGGFSHYVRVWLNHILIGVTIFFRGKHTLTNVQSKERLI
jgi:chemotaxis methyl-accepting protein methylase